jgi:hypothetical protein
MDRREYQLFVGLMKWYLPLIVGLSSISFILIGVENKLSDFFAEYMIG